MFFDKRAILMMTGTGLPVSGKVSQHGKSVEVSAIAKTPSQAVELLGEVVGNHLATSTDDMDLTNVLSASSMTMEVEEEVRPSQLDAGILSGDNSGSGDVTMTFTRIGNDDVHTTSTTTKGLRGNPGRFKAMNEKKLFFNRRLRYLKKKGKKGKSTKVDVGVIGKSDKNSSSPSKQPTLMPVKAPKPTFSPSHNGGGGLGGSEQCQNCIGYKACVGIRNGLVIPCGACNGTKSCYDFQGETIGQFSCIGAPSCYKVKDPATTIGHHSCVGAHSCSRISGTIANYSCNGNYACLENGLGSTVGDNSCNGYFACGGNSIGDNSCNGLYACFKVMDVGAGSCNGRFSCCGNQTQIGPNQCNNDYECCVESGWCNCGAN